MSGNFLDGIGQPEPPRVQIGLASLGLGTPPARFVAGVALGAVFLWAIRPSIAFHENGEAKPHSLLVSPETPSTPLPWYLLALIPGAIAGVFL